MKIMLDLFERQLQSLYNSELLILKALPKMHPYATDERLKEIIVLYTEETSSQIERLEEIGNYLKTKFPVNDGKIIFGLLEEINDLYKDFPKGILMDAGLISKLQHIQHFQISAYETAILYAKNLDLKEVEKTLETTLNEAYEADENCSYYAKSLLLQKRNK